MDQMGDRVLVMFFFFFFNSETGIHFIMKLHTCYIDSCLLCFSLNKNQTNTSDFTSPYDESGSEQAHPPTPLGDESSYY